MDGRWYCTNACALNSIKYDVDQRETHILNQLYLEVPPSVDGRNPTSFKSYFIGGYMCEENIIIYQTNTTVIHYFDTSQVPGGAVFLRHQTVTCKRDTLRRALRLVAERTPLERVVEAAGAIEDENHKRYQRTQNGGFLKWWYPQIIH